MTAGSKWKQLVDPRAARRRRFELGVSERALGAALGVEAAVIRRLERSHSQDQLTAAFVVDLAKALRIAVHQLLSPEQRPDPTLPDDDVEAVGAVLARAGDYVRIDRVAYELEWTVDRVLDALDALAGALEKVGQGLAWAGDNLVAVAHRSDDATDAVAERLVTENLAETGLTFADAKLLYAAATGHARTSRANALPVVNVRKLEMAGLITTEPEGSWKRGSGIHLTERAKRALRLPPRSTKLGGDR